MRRVSGIKFKDSRFLHDFEREARNRLTPDETAEVLNSYTIHRHGENGGVILEFRDMNDVAAFLEKARAVGLAGRTFRVIKLVAASPTRFFRMPETELDEWARERISEAGQEGRQGDSLIFTAEAYASLCEEFKAASVDISKYLR